MSTLTVPAWAQPDVEAFRTHKTLGTGAQRKPLPSEVASQMQGSLTLQMDQLPQLAGSDMDNLKDEPNVFQPKMESLPPMPIPMQPPPIRFEGDSRQGGTVMVNEHVVPTAMVCDYSPDEILMVTVISGPMPGTQAVRLNRNNPEESYVETRGAVWDMLGPAMSRVMGGAGLFGA
ncbi:MAG: hypothetical protein AB1758_36005 [Candidatus Eremiobacterota bacterium]